MKITLSVVKYWRNLFSYTTVNYSSTNAYSISGVQTVDGYKWIVFRFNKNPSDASKFTMNGVTYTLDGNDLALQSILGTYFDSTTVVNIFSTSNTNAIGFFVVNYSNTPYVGTLKMAKTATTNYFSTGTTATSLENLLTNDDTADATDPNPYRGKYGARVGSSGSYKVYINSNSMSDSYIYLYIGLK